VVAVLLVVDPYQPDPTIIAEAARRLRNGGLVAFPTESYYALGALATSAPAIDRLVAAKRRPADQPILVVIDGRAQLLSVILRLPPPAESLMARFWPGPLTLVLPARPTVPRALTASTGRLGVRLPGLPVARLLASAAGAPVTATSANRSGGPPPITAERVQAVFGDEVDLILDGGPATGGPPSTLLDLCVEPPVLLREGKISADQLRAVCRTLRRAEPASS
jgi:L-threonylcarbamoyladenylate synthase